jgi:hypothetical protein
MSKQNIKWKIAVKLNHINPILSNSLLGIKKYEVSNFQKPSKLLSVPSSAWMGLESIIKDIIDFTAITPSRCLEFGVEFGYSTVVFSNYFREVVGVDTFEGDPHAGFRNDIYQNVSQSLIEYPNIKLIKSDYKDYISNNDEMFDLIHVDIIHTYEETFNCGLWSAKHSCCTLFHDTESFPEVKRAVLDIARLTGKKFYNFPFFNGLGILF